jgi:hypothetical protein
MPHPAELIPTIIQIQPAIIPQPAIIHIKEPIINTIQGKTK